MSATADSAALLDAHIYAQAELAAIPHSQRTSAEYAALEALSASASAAHAALRVVLALRAATDEPSGRPAASLWLTDTKDWHFATLPGRFAVTIKPSDDGDARYSFVARACTGQTVISGTAATVTSAQEQIAAWLADHHLSQA